MYNLKKSISYQLVITLCFVIVSHINLNAQIVIGTPNLGFTQACANESFNTYNATFVFSPESALGSSNQFVIELSDANGDFTEATEIHSTNAGEVTVSPATIAFSFPEDTAGENYKIRIKSTSPEATSTPSTAFAAYYKLHDQPFSINNLVPTGAFCSGGSYLLTIDNPGSENNISPLLYESLTFNWYKETGPTTSEFVAEGPILNVTEEGAYFVETNYGTCTSDSFSNHVVITEVTSGEADASIVSSLGNPYCPDQGLTTLSTLSGLSYQWYKDGNIIEGATSQMYQTDASGVFSVQVDLGECSAAGEIDLVSELFESDINVDDVITLEEDAIIEIIVSTTADSPEYTWYFNDVIISGETSNTFEASEIGNYKVVITETIGCMASKTYEFTIEEAYNPFPDVPNIPNVISPNGDGINDTWMIPTQYVTGTNTEIIIMTNRGKVVLQTNDYQNNWPENDLNLTAVNQVYYYIITTTDNKTKKGTITVVK